MVSLKYLKFFRPAPHIARLPQKEVSKKYEEVRRRVFIGVIIGYTGFYLLRGNFVFAIPYLAQQGFTKTQLGIIFSALPLSYGFGKFLMALVSDHSNPRYFMATGLALSIGFNFFYGTDLVLNSFILMLVLMFFNGWVQGMGWPSLVRVMVHWFSENERGTKISIIRIVQNVVRGITGPLTILGTYIFSSWHSIFYFPAILALVAMVLVLLLLRDTPQSEGLPPVEEYRNEYSGHRLECLSSIVECEKELTAKEILFKYIFVNKYLWYLSVANIFVYLVRYGIINWAPTYLGEVKGITASVSRVSYMLYECAAIPGVFLCGWLSDKFFYGRRAPICVIYMIAVSIAILFYWFMPAGNYLYANVTLLCIGFFIYGPVMMISVQTLDLIPKKAAGTASALTGFFGHVCGAIIANAGIGWGVDYFGWDITFIMLLIACGLAILFLVLTWDANFKKIG